MLLWNRRYPRSSPHCQIKCAETRANRPLRQAAKICDEKKSAQDKMRNSDESIFSPQVCYSGNNPVSWNPPPRPLCNQAQTRWLKALLQLPVWKALFDPHQRQYSHGLQTPLGSADTTSKQSGQLFLPHAKKSLMFCSCSLTSVEYCPSLSAVSGFQDSQVMRIWHSWNCWIQHVRLCLFPQKKEIKKK